MNKPVTIIVPVYGDWPSLKDCIDSLMQCVGSEHKVLLVNDCGPDADAIEKNINTMTANDSRFEYHRNPHNLGFLKNCNRAVFELDKSGNDILLLNSDTIVTKGFIKALQGVLNHDDRIATVSPRSNNATITTIPIRSMQQHGLSPEDSYRIYQKIYHKLPQYNITPVAHGFCMLIRRSVIDEFGLFDEIFNKGYGEEVDFCMRVGKQGYKHAICNHAYVYHMEARSFTLETKKELVSVNEVIVDKRYPEYRRLVRDYRLSALEQEAMLLDLWHRRSLSKVVNGTKHLVKKNKYLHKIGKRVKSLVKN